MTDWHDTRDYLKDALIRAEAYKPTLPEKIVEAAKDVLAWDLSDNPQEFVADLTLLRELIEQWDKLK